MVLRPVLRPRPIYQTIFFVPDFFFHPYSVASASKCSYLSLPISKYVCTFLTNKASTRLTSHTPSALQSETKTRPKKNASESETRQRTLKSGFENGLDTKTDLEFYNTRGSICSSQDVFHWVRRKKLPKMGSELGGQQTKVSRGAAQTFSMPRLPFTTASMSEMETRLSSRTSWHQPPFKATVICNAKVTLSAAAGVQLP